MRPIERGAAPGQAFSCYQDAKQPLVNRLGEYCSYCEGPVSSGLHVEHILAKADHPHTEHDWDNLLLACFNCNSTKGTKSTVVQASYYWPHLDNTARAFEYTSDGRVVPSSTLTSAERLRASKTLALTGLQRFGPNASVADYRWLHRREAWSKAKEAQADLGKPRADTPLLRKWITKTAVGG